MMTTAPIIQQMYVPTIVEFILYYGIITGTYGKGEGGGVGGGGLMDLQYTDYTLTPYYIPKLQYLVHS